MHRILTILSLLLALATGTASAQEIFEVPIELELPVASLVFGLDSAILDVVIEDGAVPVLRAFGGTEGAAGAEFAITDSGTVLTVHRPEDLSEPIPRLRFELTFPLGHPLDIKGLDLDVTVAARAVVSTGFEDDDEDDRGDSEDDEADGEGDSVAQPVAVAPSHLLSLTITDSNADLSGISSANLNVTRSFVHTADTRGHLALALEGTTFEAEGHQGAVDLSSRDSEVALDEVIGQVQPALIGGSLTVRGGAGVIKGQFDDALLRVDRRKGQITIAGSGATIEGLDLIGSRVDIKGGGHDLRLDDVRGSVLADMTGGSISVGQLRGATTITARDGTEISLENVVGNPKLNLFDCSTTLIDVTGQASVEVRRGRLELDEVQRLSLVASGAEIIGSGLEGLTKLEATNSQLDLDLQKVKQNPSLTLRGSTSARVRLQAPCTVKMGEARLLSAGANVNGCDVNSKAVNVRRKRFERRGLSGQRRTILNVKMVQGSTLDVEGVP